MVYTSGVDPSGMGPGGMFAGGTAGGGGGGFDWGSLMSNPMVLQMMSKMGASLDPEGPAGAMDSVTQGWIQNKSYLEMMKKLPAGGGKMTFDKDTFNMKVPSSVLAGAFGSGGGQEKQNLFGADLDRGYPNSFK